MSAEYKLNCLIDSDAYTSKTENCCTALTYPIIAALSTFHCGFRLIEWGGSNPGWEECGLGFGIKVLFAR